MFCRYFVEQVLLDVVNIFLVIRPIVTIARSLEAGPKEGNNKNDHQIVSKRTETTTEKRNKSAPGRSVSSSSSLASLVHNGEILLWNLGWKSSRYELDQLKNHSMCSYSMHIHVARRELSNRSE